MYGAVQNEVLFVIGWILPGFAEYAIRDCGAFSPAFGYVRLSPGAPESFHNRLIPESNKEGTPAPVRGSSYGEGRGLFSLINSLSSLPALK